MITKNQLANARVIVKLADRYGRLAYNSHGQTVEGTLNLSIPCARLVVAGVVTGVADTDDGITSHAVIEVENLCRRAVDFNVAEHGDGWWNDPEKALV